MKILWITFCPIGTARNIFLGEISQSGGWIDANAKQLETYIRSGRISLHIAAIGSKRQYYLDEESLINYHLVDASSCRGKRSPKAHKEVWRKFINELSPDIIQIWGTEFTFGLDVLDVKENIPVCFFIQGVMSSLADHPMGDISFMKLLKYLGIFAFPRLYQAKRASKIDRKQSIYEKEIVKRADGIIVDSNWAEAQYIEDKCPCYYVSLPINHVFSDLKWRMETIKRHRIFTVAGGGDPTKGVHNLILATAKLTKKYPDIVVAIPGRIYTKSPHFLFDTIFIRHIKKLISDNKLDRNVIFLGALSPTEMAEQMRVANLFVMPSCVENHSSTLREAMTVGCPSISASIGCVPEYVTHGKNGFIYRYDDVNTLAFYIDKIFSDDNLASKLGEEARNSIRIQYDQTKIGEKLIYAYQKMTNKKV